MTTERHRSYLSSTLGCRCPRCREGKLFKHPVSINMTKNLEMNKECPICEQPTEIEVGFYYGTGYDSYVLSILICLISLLVWWLTIGLSVDDNRFFFWLGFNAILLIALQPWLMRLSRSIWISWFVGYDRHWKQHQPMDVSERLNADQANNW
ncbi:MAG: DUF983 domain-containing protein [Bacteroidetes bacterium]|nr:MAG: DUF983 domain-containing protein [Bacteroidota bacterium]